MSKLIAIPCRGAVREARPNRKPSGSTTTFPAHGTDIVHERIPSARRRHIHHHTLRQPPRSVTPDAETIQHDRTTRRAQPERHTLDPWPPNPLPSGHHTPSTSRFVYPGGSWGNLIEHERERMQRAVAQLGSALDWGSSGRRFKSCQPDQEIPSDQGRRGFFLPPNSIEIGRISQKSHIFGRSPRAHRSREPRDCPALFRGCRCSGPWPPLWCCRVVARHARDHCRHCRLPCRPHAGTSSE